MFVNFSMHRILLSILLITSLFAGGDAIDTLKLKTETDSLTIVADSLLKAWQLDEALVLYQNALTNYQQLAEGENEAQALKKVGLVYYYHGNAKKALPYFEKELAIHRELGDRSNEGDALCNIGVLYMQLSDYPKALDYYEKDLEICRELGDRSGEGTTLGNIGNIYINFTDYPKALEYHEKSLEISREVGDRSGEGTTLGNIGNVYKELSDYLKALEYYEKDLEICRELGDRWNESKSLYNIGSVYHKLTDYPKALEYHEKSLEISREIGNRRGEGTTLGNIGNIYKELTDYPKALEYYEKILDISRELGERRSEGLSLQNIGIIYTKQQKYSKAEEHIKQALAIIHEIKAHQFLQLCYSALGDCYVAQHMHSFAVDNYTKSIEIAENIRGKLEVEGQKTSYSAGVSGIYEKIVSSNLKLNKNEDAFNYVERSRARSFLDMLASGEVKVGKSSHKEFLKNEEKFFEKEKDLEEELIAAEENTVLSTELRGKMEEQRGLMIREREEKKEYEPELASLVTVNSLTLPQVQALLDNETILEYFLTKEKTLIWLITKDDAEVYQVDIGGDSLKAMVEDYRSAIANLSEIEEQSSELYNLLIVPAVKRIETNKLVIIPHGILHYLPFQALQDEKGKYLLEKYQISYLPSASVMKYIIPKKRDKGKTILALGNPKLDKTSFSPIPFAVQEVKAITKKYSKSKLLIGVDATEEKFRELAPNYDILHFACHAELNSAYPLYSGLLLSSTEEQDGELYVHELFTMDLNASLVILSACETGLGHLTNGDEMVGLSRAFIYAGTPSVISSLWMVEDESTSYLMEQFYNNLQKYNKAESLQKAQLQTMKKYKNLRSWASFVLVGES